MFYLALGLVVGVGWIFRDKIQKAYMDGKMIYALYNGLDLKLDVSKVQDLVLDGETKDFVYVETTKGYLVIPVDRSTELAELGFTVKACYENSILFDGKWVKEIKLYVPPGRVPGFTAKDIGATHIEFSSSDYTLVSSYVGNIPIPRVRDTLAFGLQPTSPLE